MRVLLVDAEPLVREGLRSVIGRELVEALVADAPDLDTARRLLARTGVGPHVVVLGVDGGPDGGVDAVQRTVAAWPGAAIVALAARPTGAQQAHLHRAGAAVCLDRRAAADDLAPTLRALYGEPSGPTPPGPRPLDAAAAVAEPGSPRVAGLAAVARRTAARLRDLPRRRVGGWAEAPGDPAWVRRWEPLLAASVLLAALLLRTVNLEGLPYGLHGDEAVTGIEGQRILREGWIGPYSPLALGQPAGPLYLVALSVAALGNTILAVRIVPALLGTLTVVALYWLLRRSFGVTVALVGAGLLAVMSWHVHFARIGFPLESWPLLVVLAAGALVEALRTGDRRWWAAAGAALGLGLYTYNSHPLALAILLGFAGLSVAWSVWTGRERPGRLAPAVVVGLAALLLAALPMLLFALDDPSGYLNRFNQTSMLRRPEWTSLDLGGKAAFLWTRYGSFWDRACCRPLVDGADGTGVTPLVPPAMLVLVAIGVALALVGRRGPLTFAGLLLLLLLPFGSVLTDGGLARRTLALSPFLALFAAIGAVDGIALIRRRAYASNALSLAALALLGAIAYQNLDNYFGRFPTSDARRFVFAQEMFEASRFLRDLPADRRVYFFSERWSLDYETRQYLAPNVKGEDRSTEFGRPPVRGRLDVDLASGPPVFVFLGRYRAQVDQVRALYPGGSLAVVGPTDAPSFVAYSAPG